VLLHVDVQTPVTPGEARLDLRGDLCPESAPHLAEALNAAITAGATTVIVDVSGLDFCTSHGLDVMSAYHEVLTAGGGGLELVGTEGRVAKLLGILQASDPTFLVGRTRDVA
jgi:anti-anti-sigma factor